MGYYSDVPNALMGYVRNAERENVADGTIQTVNDLISFHNEAKQKMKALLKEITE